MHINMHIYHHMSKILCFCQYIFYKTTKTYIYVHTYNAAIIPFYRYNLNPSKTPSSDEEIWDILEKCHMKDKVLYFCK